MLKKTAQQIFSITNQNRHKIITILGFKIKLPLHKTFIIDNSSLTQIKQITENSFKETRISNFNINDIERIINKSLNNYFEIKKEKSKPKIPTDIQNIAVLEECREITQCPFCKSKHYYQIRDFSINYMINTYKERYHIDPIGESIYKDKTLTKLHCLECGLEFYNYAIPDSSLLYEKLLESKKYFYPKYKWEYNQAIETIKKYNIKKVLDIGCGYGNFIENISKITDFTMGLEMNKAAIEECKNKGLNISNSSLDKINQKFDLITLFQVLEHIQEPKTFIEQVINLLEPGGYLFIGTPNPKGSWIQSNPDILNLPPHHCLDITQEFYDKLQEYFPLQKTDYIQDTLEFNLYKEYYYPSKTGLKDSDISEIYNCYLQEKDKLTGHRHICIYQKTK